MGRLSWKTVVGLAVLTACSANAVTAAVSTLVSIVVALNSSTLAVGQTTLASASLRDAAAHQVADGQPVSWKSSNASVASVSSGGVVTAIAPGATTISASAGGVSGTAPLTVDAVGVPGVVLFSDGFEGGSFSYKQGGVSWTSQASVDVSTTIAHGGTRAARFRQGESKEWAELRFGGLPSLPEVYVQYYLYMPSGTESPSVGPKVQVLGGRNDKFFRLWGPTDDYYGKNPGCEIGASLWGDGVDGGMGLEYQYTPPTGAQWAMGEGDPNGYKRVPFVVDGNRGRWLRIRIRARVASAANNDGVIQIWVDNTLLLSNTALHNYSGATGPHAFTNGYLLGWANNGYAAGQFTYLDDMTISTGGFPAL